MSGLSIILFTESYPLGGVTEPSFVQPELSPLKASFDRVIVVPAQESPVGDRCVLPTGIELDDSYAASRVRKLDAKVVLRDWRAGIDALIAAIRSWHGVDLFRADWRRRAEYRMFRKWFARFLADHGLDCKDLVIYTFWMGMEAEFVGRYFMNRPQPLLISRGHQFDIEDQPQTAFRDLALQSFDAFFACSKDGAAKIRKLNPKLNCIVDCDYLGVRNESEHLNPDDGHAGELVFYTCFNFCPRKNGLGTADCLMELARRRPDCTVRWILVGDGDGRESVMQRVERAPSNFKMDWRGRLSNAEVLKILSSEHIDFSVLLSFNEGLAVMLQESLAHGIPVICTDVGGNRECVRDSSGILLGSRVTPDEFCRVVIPRISTSGEMRRCAYAVFVDQFDAGLCRENFVQRIVSMTKNRRCA